MLISFINIFTSLTRVWVCVCACVCALTKSRFHLFELAQYYSLQSESLWKCSRDRLGLILRLLRPSTLSCFPQPSVSLQLAPAQMLDTSQTNSGPERTLRSPRAESWQVCLGPERDLTSSSPKPLGKWQHILSMLTIWTLSPGKIHRTQTHAQRLTYPPHLSYWLNW